MISIKKKNNGFTIIELMIATTVFATILMVCMTGIILLGKNYYKGIIMSRTQNTARSVMDTITQSIQYSSASPIPLVAGAPGTGTVVSAGDASGVFCVGKKRFTYNKGINATTAAGALIMDELPLNGNCTASTTGKELLSQNMRLQEFQILKNGENYDIHLVIMSGDPALADPPNTGNLCAIGSGSQFCASARLETSVRRRI